MFVEKLRFDGKVAMVVGAGGGGHGTASAVALAEAGADIIALDISEGALADVERRVKALGRRCLPLVADVRSSADVNKAVAAGEKHFGAIHCLANIVGGNQPGEFHNLLDYPDDDLFDKVLDINLKYAFRSCRAVARGMVERKIAGSIVNISSVSALPSAPSHAFYGAAKNGLNALSRTMALEWSQYGIRVNLVAPGNVNAPRKLRLSGEPSGPEDFEKLMDERRPNTAVPLGWAGSAFDIGSAVLFLLSDMARYISGQLLVVDGGMSVKANFATEVHRGRSGTRGENISSKMP